MALDTICAHVLVIPLTDYPVSGLLIFLHSKYDSPTHLCAGVPLKRMVAGVAMGLILEPSGEFQVLTDILGSEDALGDMDFKVAGDEEKISAFQLDIKVEGITLDIMKAALVAARKGRQTVLSAMADCNPPPRRSLSVYAPRIMKVTVPADKVGMLIGSGGKTIRSIEEVSGAQLDVDGDNQVAYVKAYSDDSMAKAMTLVRGIIVDPEVGMVLRQVKVVSVQPFGAFVELAPSKDGLVHISEWDVSRIANMADVVKEGDLVDVKVLEVADNGKVKLSRKTMLIEDGLVEAPSRSSASEEEEARSDMSTNTNYQGRGGGNGRRGGYNKRKTPAS